MGYFDEFQRAGGNTGGERYFDEFKNQPPQDSSLLDKAKGFLNSIDDAYEEGRAARKAQWEKTKANVWNTLSDYAANAGKAIENYGNEITAAGERALEAYNNGESINMEDPTQGFEGENYNRAKMNVYNELVGKPAGYTAITPGMPGIVRMAGAALATPTLLDSTMQTYDQNIANDDGTPVISTAKEALLDPVINPVKEVVTHPGAYAQSLVDNPTELWDKVFLPGAVIHGAAKGIKKATPKSISEPIREHVTEPFNEHVIDPVKSGLANAKGRFFDSFKRGGETGFDDLARDTEMGTQSLKETNLPPEYGETGDIKTDVYNRLRQNGFTDSEAAGITGNIAQESMFDTEALSKDGYNSRGLVQWTGDRKAHLEQFAREHGLDPKDWRTQVDFISEEMNTTERAAFEALRKNPNITPEEAAHIVREQYERPDPAVANDAYRQQIAREVYDGRSVRPVQRSIQQNSLNDFAEDVKQVAPEEANLNFMKDKENKNAVDDAVKAFTSGHGENMSISDSRAFATGLIKDTVQNPDFILKQKNGRKLYVNLWRGKDNLLHQIAVSMDKTDKWYAQPVWERMKGSVSFGGKENILRKTLKLFKDSKEVARKVYHEPYTTLVDELHPLEELIGEVEKRIGRKLSVEENAFKQAWLARGWAGKAEALLQHGDKRLGVKAFKDVIRQIPENRLEDFSTYLTALRELDMNKWNEVLPLGEEPLITRFTKAECFEAIKHYEKSPVFKKAAAEVHKYSDTLLHLAVEGGMLTARAAADMKAKYPHYVPFFREFYEAAEAQRSGTGKGFANVGAVTKKMRGSTLDIVDPLEGIIRNTFTIMNAIERNKVGQSIVKLANVDGMGALIEKVSGAAKVTDHSFSVWKNGKKVVYNTTPELYQAFKMLNPEGANMFTKLLSYPAKWLRAGATLGPEFILRNPVRDMISATIYSKHGFIPVVDTLKGLGLYLQKGETYWEYMRSGAAQANLVSLDRNYLSGQMRDLLQRPSVKKMVTTNPIEILRGLSEATEMATRLAEFHNVRKGYTGIGNRLFSKKRNPGSIQEAALESRDVTLDFSRIGSHTKSLNKTIAFFNAAIQGTDKMFREWKANPRDMTVKTAMWITLPSVLLWELNKDDPRYQELPQWQKDIFWIIPTKDTLIKIPKPFELGILFGTVPERMLQWDYDKKRKQKGAGFKGLAGSVLDSMAPSFLPTALVPAIEAMTNHSIFMGRDIVPQSQQNTIPELQYGPYTSAVGRKIGETFGVSPRKIDNTIRGYGGSLAGLGLTLTDQMVGLDETRPAKRFSEQPGIRGFTATPYANSESVQEVYDAYDRQLKLFNAGRELHRRMDGFDPREFEQMKNAVKAFQNINQAKKAVMKSDLSSDAKRKRLDEIQMSQVRIARRALGKESIK